MRHHSKQIKNVADHTAVAAFTIDDNNDNIRSDKRKQILKSKSVLKKRKYRKFGDGEWMTIIMLCLAALPCMIECQFPTRDPRWYSREGEYPWPNPGDPEYR